MGNNATPHLPHLSIQDDALMFFRDMEFTQDNSLTVTLPGYIDSKNSNLLQGVDPLYLFAQVSEDLVETAGVNLQFLLKSTNTIPAPPAALVDAQTHYTGVSIPVSTLTAGTLVVVPIVNTVTCLRYIAVEAVTSAGGNITDGMFSMGLCTFAGAWVAHPSGLNFYRAP